MASIYLFCIFDKIIMIHVKLLGAQASITISFIQEYIQDQGLLLDERDSLDHNLAHILSS